LTSRIQLGVGVGLGADRPMPRWEALNARLATVDVLAEGRLAALLGSNPMGGSVGPPTPIHDRQLEDLFAEVRQMREQNERLRSDRLRPRHIPFLLGCWTSAGIETAAGVADGVGLVGNNTVALGHDIAEFRAHAAAARRDPDTLPVIVLATADPGHAEPDQLFHGPVDDLATAEKLGVSQVIVGLDAPISDQLAIMARLSERYPGPTAS
jgi:alkanesulfonate monooxygenase SsuD/methylene tetrahydromethanopterin reductase-like flavin-dependent oxidoreductase (luciferase family)